MPVEIKKLKKKNPPCGYLSGAAIFPGYTVPLIAEKESIKVSPGAQEDGQSWGDVPGQTRLFSPLLLIDGLAAPCRDRLLAGNVQLTGTQRVVPCDQTLHLIGLEDKRHVNNLKISLGYLYILTALRDSNQILQLFVRSQEFPIQMAILEGAANGIIQISRGGSRIFEKGGGGPDHFHHFQGITCKKGL